jgi:hypothetical protein
MNIITSGGDGPNGKRKVKSYWLQNYNGLACIRPGLSVQTSV